ncbi:10093_t:CDS:1, partial [Cetraspora pellucida]
MEKPVIYIDPQRARNLDREITLQKIYYRPEGYYRTAKKMQDTSRRDEYNFSLAKIRNWLNKQAIFQVHKLPSRYIPRFLFNTIQIPNEYHQADILYMPYDKIRKITY